MCPWIPWIQTRQLAYRDFVSLESPYAPLLDRELVEAPF